MRELLRWPLVLVLCTVPLSVWAEEPLRDPTRPANARSLTAVPGMTFKVTAVFLSGQRRLGVVNGRLVAEGDGVDGARVVEVLPSAIRLEYQGKVVTARLLDSEVSTRRESEN